MTIKELMDQFVSFPPDTQLDFYNHSEDSYMHFVEISISERDNTKYQIVFE